MLFMECFSLTLRKLMEFVALKRILYQEMKYCEREFACYLHPL
jgi:hypothetical protein